MDVGGVLLAVCGLSVACIGSILVLAFVVLRFTGANLLGPILGDFLGGDDDEASIERDYGKPKRHRFSGRSELRAKSQDLDFDSAVQRYRQKTKGKGKHDSDAPAPNRLGGAARFDDPPPRRSLRRNRNREDDTYEIYDDGEEGWFE